MATAVEQLTKLVESPGRYDIPLADLLETQIEAANERLAEHRQSIKLVANRAETAGISEISEPADLVPLLFAHTAYKSYPEAWLNQGKWAQMCSWLSTVSATPVVGVDNENVSGLDEWIERLAAKGHYISCSSGTSGKVSMIPSSMADRNFVKRVAVATYEWVTGIAPNHDRKIFVCSPGTNNFRFLDSWQAFADEYGNGEPAYRFPGRPVTVGRTREMIMLRKAIAEGTARPGDIAAVEAETAARAAEMEGAVGSLAEALLAARDDKLLIAGMPALLFQVADAIAQKGFKTGDFDAANTLMMSGGLKGAVVPDDYFERILAAFNIAPAAVFNMYGMQELNSFTARCSAGRFHVAPWLMVLPLDPTGETLLDASEREIEGRAAFFDLSHEGRWGGIISGDKVTVAHGQCACGHQGPTIGGTIARFSDLPGGDKISCSGSIDAYVRGVTA
jgi:hypothetical protein